MFCRVFSVLKAAPSPSPARRGHLVTGRGWLHPGGASPVLGVPTVLAQDRLAQVGSVRLAFTARAGL